jgi:hypothetical protein
MATAIAKKPTVEGIKPVSKDRAIFDLDMRLIKSNKHQTRAAEGYPAIQAAGYGIFAPLDSHKDNKPLWDLLLSDNPEEMALGVQIIQKYAPDVAERAGSFMIRGQLNPIGVTPYVDADTGKESNKYKNINNGLGRTLSKAYIYAQSGGKVAPTIEARGVVAKDEVDRVMTAWDENNLRRGENVVDKAHFYATLKRLGMSDAQIGEKYGEKAPTVRAYRQVAELPDSEQDKIREGKIGWTKALDKWKASLGQKGVTTSLEESGDNSRVRMPTTKKARLLYEALEKPKDVNDEEWALLTEDVRKYFAYCLGEIVGPYQTRRELKADKDKQEKAAHDAAKAKAKEVREAAKNVDVE